MERVTINIRKKTAQRLSELVTETGGNKTDLICQGIDLLHLVRIEGAEVSLQGQPVRLMW